MSTWKRLPMPDTRLLWSVAALALLMTLSGCELWFVDDDMTVEEAGLILDTQAAGLEMLEDLVGQRDPQALTKTVEWLQSEPPRVFRRVLYVSPATITGAC